MKSRPDTLVQIDSIQMLTEEIDLSYDIEGIKLCLKQNEMIKQATFKYLKLFRI
jgi:hypothetical protein